MGASPKKAPRSPTASSSVVLYDAGSHSREVLTFGFEREDFEVFATDNAEEAKRLVTVSGAHMLVVSIGQEASFRAEALSFIGDLRDRAEKQHEMAMVVLGRRDLREDALRAGADEFVSWPAFIRDAVTLARLALAARGEQGAGLSGLLEDYEVYFLVRALAAASRSAAIELERGGRKAHIHVARGEVVAAKVGRLSGVAALHHLLLWAEATLRLRFVSPPGERKISVPVDDLLQSGVKFVDEFEKLAARVGGPHATFEKRPDRFDDPKLKIPAEVRAFAEAVVSGVTLVDLVETSPFKPFDTIKVCYRLCELGLVTRRDPVRSISPLTAQLAVRDWLLGTAAPQPRSTVTEAGRRAAEAYAEAAAARARAAEPEEELFAASAPPSAAPAPPPPPQDDPADQTVRVEKLPALKPAKVARAKATPRAPINGTPVAISDEAPTAPREAVKGQAARNKGKAAEVRKEAQAAPYTPAPAPPPLPAQPPTKPAPEAIAAAPAKEPVTFDEMDEAFFAKEAELSKVEPVDTFDDLDETGRKRRLAKKAAKKKWL